MPVADQEIEELLLGDPLRHTRAELERLSGVPQEFGLRLWQALGFPVPAEDEVAFTDRDLGTLREIRELLNHDLVDEELVLALSRAVGTTMGRLASWLGGVWLQRLVGEDPADVATALAATAELRPRFEELLLDGWRRHLAAVGRQALVSTASATADPVAGTALLSVGFADVVSFTRLSRQMDGDELAAFVEGFEVSASEVVAGLGGRVVKTLGDEILFTADDAATAAEIGLRIAERGEDDPNFPRVRVGMARGEVVLRLGDVFGTPVNLAARLTATAHPGTVLVDGGLAGELPVTAPYETAVLRPRSLQGLGRVRPRLLRRA